MGVSAAGAEAAVQADGAVGSCTPELVYDAAPGSLDASGAGTGQVAVLRYTDANGSLRPATSATIAWSVRAIVDERAETGARPSIGGDLDLDIVTADGERLTFSATCVAGSGAAPIGIVLYANGLTRGWAGGSTARKSFVHFEAWTEGGQEYAYVALIDGADCALNFGVQAVTRPPFAVGTGTFSGLPSQTVYAETNCARRFGDPFPRSLAPGLQ
jgi:hypothetical protein